MGNLPKFDHAEATRELRGLLDELEQRIARQQRRIEKALLERTPADDLKASLDDMRKSRDFMQSQIDRMANEGAA